MISINCTQCQQLLEMDEAFAGGVCRCQFCGTIQTVPSHLKNQKAKSSGPSPKPNKALYKKGSGGQPGTGLDELAEVVASSGLSRKSLAGTTPTREQSSVRRAPAAPKRNPLVPVLIIGSVVVAALVVLVVYFAMKSGGGSGPTSPTGSTAKTSAGAGGVGGPGGQGDPLKTRPDDPAPTKPPPTPITGPSFAGVELPRGPVVYLIDRSQANADVLDTAKSAVYRSALSLGADRRFQIVFWKHGEEGVVAFPESGSGAATPTEVDAAEKRLFEVIGYGQTELKPALELALKANPTEIVLLTAKGFQLDEDTAAMVKDTLKGAAV